MSEPSAHSRSQLERTALKGAILVMGGVTTLKFRQEGADLRVSVDGSALKPATEIEIVLGGDAEYETFVELLGTAVSKLKHQHQTNIPESE